MLRVLAVGFCLLLGAAVHGWRDPGEPCALRAIDDETLEHLKRHRQRIIAKHLAKIDQLSSLGHTAIAYRTASDFEVAERIRLAQEFHREQLGQRLKEFDGLVARLSTHRRYPGAAHMHNPTTAKPTTGITSGEEGTA